MEQKKVFRMPQDLTDRSSPQKCWTFVAECVSVWHLSPWFQRSRGKMDNQSGDRGGAASAKNRTKSLLKNLCASTCVCVCVSGRQKTVSCQVQDGHPFPHTTQHNNLKKKCFLIVSMTHYCYLHTCAVWGGAQGPSSSRPLCHQSDQSALTISGQILWSLCTQDTAVLKDSQCKVSNHLWILLLSPHYLQGVIV